MEKRRVESFESLIIVIVAKNEYKLSKHGMKCIK